MKLAEFTEVSCDKCILHDPCMSWIEVSPKTDNPSMGCLMNEAFEQRFSILKQVDLYIEKRLDGLDGDNEQLQGDMKFLLSYAQDLGDHESLIEEKRIQLEDDIMGLEELKDSLNDEGILIRRWEKGEVTPAMGCPTNVEYCQHLVDYREELIPQEILVRHCNDCEITK